MPKLQTKRLLKLFLLASILATGSACTIAIHHGKKLASPDRRPVQDYHTEYLQKPHLHGIQIQRLDCLNNTVPCLVVTADPRARLGDRGTTIRSQIRSPLPEHGTTIGNIILLHGRNGRKEDLLPVAERFCAVGLRCLIPDLPAHGDSPVDTSHFGLKKWEAQLPGTVLSECAAHFNFTKQPSALWGISMGGSFATSAASTDPGAWTSLTIVSSFDRLDKIVSRKTRFAALAGLVSKTSQRNGGADPSQIQPKLWAMGADLPVLVAHGTDDQLIPIASGKNLFNSFPSEQKRWIEVEGGTHSNVLTTPMPLYSEMAQWILGHLNAAPVQPTL